MSNPYAYSGSYQHYSPPHSEGQMNTSPVFHNMAYVSGSNGATLSSSASSTTSSMTSNYSLHNPRLRYYLSKSFDAEDDFEFCPDIPDFPGTKKFDPYTASVFSPTGVAVDASSPPPASQQGARVQTPRVKKIIEIVNPHTKVRVGSPAISK